jgi:DNA-binding FadR family transcriptional regulator
MKSSGQFGASQRRFVEVAQTVLKSIMDGRYPRGQRLPPDRDLAAGLGVSRQTAREALLVLELIGAIVVRHGDGVYVSTNPNVRIDEDDVILNDEPRDLIESRSLLEPITTRLSAERVTDAEVGRLHELVDEAERIADDIMMFPRFREISFQFHAELAADCGSRILGEVVAQLVNVERHPLWVLINEQALLTTDARLGQVHEHRSVLAAIEAGDPARAEAEMRRHLVELERTIFSKERPTARGVVTAPPDAAQH